MCVHLNERFFSSYKNQKKIRAIYFKWNNFQTESLLFKQFIFISPVKLHHHLDNAVFLSCISFRYLLVNFSNINLTVNNEVVVDKRVDKVFLSKVTIFSKSMCMNRVQVHNFIHKV